MLKLAYFFVVNCEKCKPIFFFAISSYCDTLNVDFFPIFRLSGALPIFL